MKRNKFNLSNFHLSSMRMGDLVPINVIEALPGDTFQGETSMLARVAPLVAPVMHPVHIRIHHWFVPNRLLWDGWESFITGGQDGQGDGVGAPPFQGWNTVQNDHETLGEYMGLPTTNDGFIQVSEFPIRAYEMIYNEFYRDQDTPYQTLGYDAAPPPVAWPKDYFTTARPWPQRGPDINIPVNITRDVDGQAMTLDQLGVGGDSFTITGNPGNFSDQAADLTFSNSIADMREAFAMQRYAEARARYGARYTEYLRYLGVNPADARLQRPEYLGGGKQTISFSEVLNTTKGTDNAALGEMGGHGIAAARTGKFRKYIPEHGIIMSLVSIVPMNVYQQGVHRMFSRETKEDYFQKELQHIGQQEVLRKEIYGDGTAGDDEVFGYQDRYDEYRRAYSRVSGDFRETLNYYHMGRIFASAPTLNQSFLECKPTDRTFVDQTADAQQIWTMIQNRVSARRMLTKNATPKVM